MGGGLLPKSSNTTTTTITPTTTTNNNHNWNHGIVLLKRRKRRYFPFFIFLIVLVTIYFTSKENYYLHTYIGVFQEGGDPERIIRPTTTTTTTVVGDTPTTRTRTEDSAENHKRRKPVVVASQQQRNRNVILLGPHDRYNFGDLLFEKVVSKLLQLRRGYRDDQILRTGLLPMNMSQYGGHATIYSIQQVQQMSWKAAALFQYTNRTPPQQQQQPTGPFDIIYLGGQSMGCSYQCGKDMYPPHYQTQFQFHPNNITNCAYLVPKRYFQLPQKNDTATTNTKNRAIVNSLGIGSQTIHDCIDAAKTSDYISFRNPPPSKNKQPDSSIWPSHYPPYELRPDSAIMTKQLFHPYIQQISQTSPYIRDIINKGNYIAVQHKAQSFVRVRATPTRRARNHTTNHSTTTTTTATTRLPNDPKEYDTEKLLQFARHMDDLSQRTNLTIVFFAAGTVPGHDSLELYKHIQQSIMKEPSIVFEREHLWEIIALIANAHAVISTSLHVRIMAFIYFQPRITLCSSSLLETNKHSKHNAFIQLWESTDASPCIEMKDSLTTTTTTTKDSKETITTNVLYNELQKYLGDPPQINQTKTIAKYRRNVKEYLEGFDKWSRILRTE